MTPDTKSKIELLLDAAETILRARRYDDRESEGEILDLIDAAEWLTYSVEDARHFSERSAELDALDNA